MTLATKNGSIIVKDGALAENCGCCGQCAPQAMQAFWQSLSTHGVTVSLAGSSVERSAATMLPGAYYTGGAPPQYAEAVVYPQTESPLIQYRLTFAPQFSYLFGESCKLSFLHVDDRFTVSLELLTLTNKASGALGYNTTWPSFGCPVRVNLFASQAVRAIVYDANQLVGPLLTAGNESCPLRYRNVDYAKTVFSNAPQQGVFGRIDVEGGWSYAKPVPAGVDPVRQYVSQRVYWSGFDSQWQVSGSTQAGFTAVAETQALSHAMARFVPDSSASQWYHQLEPPQAGGDCRYSLTGVASGQRFSVQNLQMQTDFLGGISASRPQDAAPSVVTPTIEFLPP